MRVDFSNLSLKNEVFDRANLKGASFVDTELNDASFEEVLNRLDNFRRHISQFNWLGGSTTSKFLSM